MNGSGRSIRWYSLICQMAPFPLKCNYYVNCMGQVKWLRDTGHQHRQQQLFTAPAPELESALYSSTSFDYVTIQNFLPMQCTKLHCGRGQKTVKQWFHCTILYSSCVSTALYWWHAMIKHLGPWNKPRHLSPMSKLMSPVWSSPSSFITTKIIIISASELQF